MAPSNPLADWEKVGDGFYRNTRIYEAVFADDFELENFIVAGAPYGGAIALYRDESKLSRYRDAQTAKSSIDIYSYSGKLISRINWEHGSIKGLGWSDDEELLIVTEDGTVRRYFGLHGDFAPFSLGNGAEEYGVRACRFWSSGFVALLSNNQLISVSHYNEPRPKLLATCPEGEVSSWSLIPPAYTLSRSVEVLLAVDKTIYTVDATDAEDRVLQNGPFKHVSVSPTGRFVALFTNDGKVWVVSSDFQNKFSEYDSKAKTPPMTIEWCGDDSVILAWEDEIHMVGPNGAAAKYYYDGRVHVIPEFDGIRLLTNDACEFLHKISVDVTEDVFRLGSTSPASVLLDSVDQLDKKSPKADENIQRIRQNLSEAVDICVKAAGHEFDPYWQKRLLKAASFGKSVLELYSSDDFVEMTEKLRVLKAVRDFQIGMPISYEQYMRLTPEKLVERLVNRHEYLLAIRISEYLHISADKIYVHWASQKVKVSTADDDALCRLIVQRLDGKPGISFELIAQSAYDEGRSHLATQLLSHEPRAGKQVPLLLSMEEDGIALDKALESGDTDLVYCVLLHLKKKLPLASFFRLISDRPTASALVETSAREGDIELLKDLYYQDDKPLDGSNILLSEALKQTEVQSKIEKLHLAAHLLSDSKDPIALFQQKSLSEAAHLLKIQETLDKEIADGPEFSGLGVNETIYRLIRSGYGKRAQKIQNECKVSEKTYWWARLRALVAKRDWGELEELGRVKKSPIGWEPFYNEILGAGNTKLASVFVPKCTNLPAAARIEMWMKCGMIVKAGEEALRVKDLNTLELLRAKASGVAVSEIDRMINQLRPRK
ncbi:Vps16, N-terminal region domain containing protein [Elaphomyces granulatus]